MWNPLSSETHTKGKSELPLRPFPPPFSVLSIEAQITVWLGPILRNCDRLGIKNMVLALLTRQYSHSHIAKMPRDAAAVRRIRQTQAAMHRIDSAPDHLDEARPKADCT